MGACLKEMTLSTSHLLVLIFITRFLSATGVRIMYPLAPFLEDDWKLSREQFGIIFSISELAAIPAVFVAPLADKYSAKILSFLAFFLMTVSFLLISFDLSTTEQEIEESNTNSSSELFNPMFPLALTSRIMFVFGYQVFFAIAIAVTFGAVSNKIKLQVACIIELSFGFSGLIGVPLILFIYDLTDFQSIFIGLAVIFFLFSLDILYKYPSFHLQNKKETNDDKDLKVGNKEPDAKVTFREIWKGLNHVSVWCYNANAVFVMFAQNGLFTVFSFWVSDVFDVESSELSVAFFVIGAAEVLGGLLVTFTVLQLKSKLYLITYAMTVIYGVSSLGLILAESVDNYATALLFTFLFFFTNSFVIVFTLAETEAYVESKFRNSVISLHSVAMFIGRSIGALVGERIYSEVNLSTFVFSIIFCTLIAFVLLRIGEKTKRNICEEDSSTTTEAVEDGEPIKDKDTVVLG